VNVDLFTPEGPVAPRAERHRIVSIGRFVPRKGFDIVVRALPTIPDTELVIVGGPDESRLYSDPEARRLLKLAADLGVADRVQLYGSVAREDMPAILRSADVVACTPWYEPFGIVPLEAMTCGVPVVAPAVGGMLDTIVHDVTGRRSPLPRRGIDTPTRLVTEVSQAVRLYVNSDLLGRDALAATPRCDVSPRWLHGTACVAAGWPQSQNGGSCRTSRSWSHVPSPSGVGALPAMPRQCSRT
jgi:glycosyltransferase involved in cell wall biosynthesis